ncbi:hypothetical protein H3J60_004575 [Salmonella enterica]|nr:hypothetical protein [Salmonella enterica]
MAENISGGLSCPDCASQRLYRVGRAKKGEHQRYQCRDCQRCFQEHYEQAGFDTGVRAKALALHLAGETQTRIREELGLSYNTIRSIVRGHPRGNTLPPCPYCRCAETTRFGTDNDRVTQRYRCKGCNRTFSDRTRGGKA